MISDVLADAVVEIDDYLLPDKWPGAPFGEVRSWILAVRRDMDVLRTYLDIDFDQPTEGPLIERKRALLDGFDADAYESGLDAV